MSTELIDPTEHNTQRRKAFFEDWWRHLDSAGVTDQVIKVHSHRYDTEVYTILHPRREGDLLYIEIGSCKISNESEVVRATTYTLDGKTDHSPDSLLSLANILTSFLCRPSKP